MFPRPISTAVPLSFNRGWRHTLCIQPSAVARLRRLKSGINRPWKHTVRWSLNQGPALRGIELLASRNRGQQGLEILQKLSDGEGYTVILKGICCLQAYCNHISSYSVEEAKKVMAADGAGEIVEAWVSQPQIQTEIESNHKQNDILLSLVSYTLVGAGKAAMLDTWIKKYRPGSSWSRGKKHYMRYQWTDLMRWALVQALIDWNPDKLADPGYDYFSNGFEDYWFHTGHLRDYFHYDKTSAPWVWTTISLDKHYVKWQYPASSKSYERCANNLIAFQILFYPEIQSLLISSYALLHPVCPSVEPFLSFCLEVLRDENHPIRFFESRKRGARRPAGWLLRLGKAAKECLSNQRREEAELIDRVIYGIWGRQAQRDYGVRRKEWEQRNQEKVKTRLPRSYIQYEF
ncbi:hypothetical protein F5Y08DRAFT_346983 [Xylaria arbuscula]|nr:hypothetical protein F5Y08DRAFT_346983 [Xylaria arbuscula]